MSGHTYKTAEVKRPVLKRLSAQKSGSDRNRVGDVLSDNTESKYRANSGRTGESEKTEQTRHECGGPDCVNGRTSVAIDTVQEAGSWQGAVARESKVLARRNRNLLNDMNISAVRKLMKGDTYHAHTYHEPNV